MIPLLVASGSQHAVLVYETAAPESPMRLGDRPVVYLEAGQFGPVTLARWIIAHRGEFDILHIHSHVDRLFLSYLTARLLGWKVIYSSTLSDTLSELVATYRPVNRPIARMLFSLIDLFVGISPRLLSPSLPEARRKLIPQGVRLPSPAAQGERDRVRAQLGFAEDETVLLYLGSISERKGIHHLIDAFRKVHALRPRARLLLVGPVLEPEYWNMLRQREDKSGLFARIGHIPFDPAPSRYYAAADMFVFASTDEGFGNVLLEAMSHGLAVVSRYLDGVTEAFIEHGRTGFLFSSDISFADQIVTLIDDPALRARIGAAARASVAAEYEIRDIASQYNALYRELKAPASAPRRDTATPHARAAAGMHFRAAVLPPSRPTLLIVVDTESEFDWSKGVTADRGAVGSIERLPEVQAICERHGVQPCYVVDHPVATNPASAAIMRQMAARGAEIGAHLQPWTTPPFIEPVDNRHAFPGNLRAWLQRQKLGSLVAAIEENIGLTPKIFKAGRYGIGRETLSVLEELGFDVDLSVAPGFDYSDQAGPDFTRFGARLSWFGEKRDLLEIPTTSGFIGPLRSAGPLLWRALDKPGLRLLKLRGLLARTGLLARARLSPEGYRLATMKQLTREMLGAGICHLTLSFHSSSLQPGFTPYCATAADVRHLLDRLDSYLRFFREELGGDAIAPHALFRQLRAQGSGAA